MNKRQTVAAYRNALGLVEKGEFREAVRLGRKILAERYSGGFEAVALGYDGLGKRDEAIRALERGVKKAPGVWRLWQLLGNLLSDAGRFGRALECYAEALGCEGVDRSSVHYNRALVFARQEKPRASLEALAKVGKRFQPLLRVPLEAEMLFESGRRAAGVRLLDAFLSKTIRSRKKLDESIAPPLAKLAELNWRFGKPRKAREWLRDALALDPGGKRALWLQREMDSRTSNKAKYYRIMVEGRFPEGVTESGKALGFFRNFEAAAESLEEALEFVRRIELPEAAGSLTVAEVETMRNPKGNPLGLYEVGPYHMFPIGACRGAVRRGRR
ncbi:MAG: hypothetical protein MUC63_06970 [Planctomycetes bacterium]|jgi:tetratricopeptide (TPR) repeat protein|nr:hypothetical protein [Planctomycetota bacterium]